MQIDVRELEEGPLTLTGEVPLRELNFDPAEIHILGPVVVNLTAEQRAQRVRVRGRFAVDVEVPCARCLDPVRVPLVSEFDQFYQSNAEQQLVGEIVLSERDTEVGFFNGDFIEVSEIVREQILLALPMKPICREGCKGLCPYCGRNRNAEACNCQTSSVDPRLAPLLKIKDQMQSD
jgi:DUF177 domain-containing protein